MTSCLPYDGPERRKRYLMTVEQAARVVSRRPRTVREWICSSSLPATKHGSSQNAPLVIMSNQLRPWIEREMGLLVWIGGDDGPSAARTSSPITRRAEPVVFPQLPMDRPDRRGLAPLALEQVAHVLRISVIEAHARATREEIPGAYQECGRWIVDPIIFRRWVTFLRQGSLTPAPRVA